MVHFQILWRIKAETEPANTHLPRKQPLQWRWWLSVTCMHARSRLHHAVVVKVLNVVQSSLMEYERLTGRRSDAEASSVVSPTSFSGYTVALLEAVAKMSVYLKEVMSYYPIVTYFCLCFRLCGY